MLFNATLDRMTEGDLELLVSQQQPSCECLTSRNIWTELNHVVSEFKAHTGTQAVADQAVHSLLMIGAIALHKYQSVNPT